MIEILILVWTYSWAMLCDDMYDIYKGTLYADGVLVAVSVLLIIIVFAPGFVVVKSSLQGE